MWKKYFFPSKELQHQLCFCGIFKVFIFFFSVYMDPRGVGQPMFRRGRAFFSPPPRECWNDRYPCWGVIFRTVTWIPYDSEKLVVFGFGWKRKIFDNFPPRHLILWIPITKAFRFIHLIISAGLPHCLTTLRYLPVLSILSATLSRKIGILSRQML